MFGGGGAQKRKMKKAKAKAYNDALQKVERIEGAESPRADTLSSLDEAYGNQLDGRTRALARKADSQAAAISRAERSDPSLKEAVTKYNDRYDTMRKQFSGERVKRYKVEDGKSSSTLGLLGTTAGPFQVRQRGSEFEKTYATKEEAMQAASAIQPKKDIFGGQPQTMDQISAAANKKVVGTTPGANVVEQDYESLKGAGYKQLGALAATFEDFDKFGKEVNAAPTIGAREKYAQLAEVISNRIGSMAPTQDPEAGKAKGLLASSIKSGGPAVGKVRV